MPEWLGAVLAFISGSGLLTGIGIWFKWRREDRLAEKLADATQIKEQTRTIFDLQQERIKDAREGSEGATRIARGLEQISQQLTMMAEQLAYLVARAKGEP